MSTWSLTSPSRDLRGMDGEVQGARHGGGGERGSMCRELVMVEAEVEAACAAAVTFVNIDACDLSFAMAALLPEDDPEYLQQTHKHEMRCATHATCKTTPCNSAP